MNESTESYADGEHQPVDGDERGLVRPFTARGSAAQSNSDQHRRPQDDDQVDAAPLVRPYYLTGGRTRTHRPLAIEALVALTDVGQRLLPTLRLERLAIANAVIRPVSVAEVAARTGLHLGVARVLVADMAAEDLVTTSDAPVGVADDIDLITRLIHGVRAL